MNKLQWFPFYGRDFFFDEHVKTLTLRQQGVYLHLLWHEWEEGSLPTADRCCLFPSFSHDALDDQLSAFEFTVNAARHGTRSDTIRHDVQTVHGLCFTVSPTHADRFINARLEAIRLEQIEKINELHNRGVKAGKASARARHDQHRTNIRPTIVKHRSNIRPTQVNQSESESESESESSPDSSSPRILSSTLQSLKTPDLKSKDESKEFEQFWASYPRKTGKKAAAKAWEHATDKPLLTEILAAVTCGIRSAQWQKEHGQFIPHPATWLNQGRWEDKEMAATKQRPPIPPPKTDPIARGGWKRQYGDPKDYGYE